MIELARYGLAGKAPKLARHPCLWWMGHQQTPPSPRCGSGHPGEGTVRQLADSATCPAQSARRARRRPSPGTGIAARQEHAVAGVGGGAEEIAGDVRAVGEPVPHACAGDRGAGCLADGLYR